MKRSVPRPFLKWAGGKGQVLPALRDAMPTEFNRYFEPFCGGGALFFALKPGRAFLSDINAELMECYRAVRDNVDGLIHYLGHHVYDKELYYQVRAIDPETLSPLERAARTIYLNRTGFNGLYRVNRSGKFNVPFGRYKNPTICDEANLRACSSLLGETSLESGPFENVLSQAKKGDFVYFDPPYIPLSKTASFTSYQSGGFGMDEQELLAFVFERLTQRGVSCMLSNSDVPWMHARFEGFNVQRIQVRRAVNSKANARGPVGEVIVTNY